MSRTFLSFALFAIVTYLVGCGQKIHSPIPAGNNGDSAKKSSSVSDGVVLLSDLMATLPRNLWPEDQDDTLKWSQAEEWYKENVVGKRARWRFVASEIRFEPQDNGRFNAHLTVSGDGIKLGGYQVPWRMGGVTSQHNKLFLFGLSPEAADKLRSHPSERALEATLTVESVLRPQTLYGNLLYIVPTEVTITDVGP